MLTISHYNQKGIFEKVIRAKNGALMRVHFEVYEIDGNFRGRVISVESISLLAVGVSNSTKCLPAVCLAETKAESIVSTYAPIVSPYLELYFFMSQPTRAPAFR